MNIFRSLLILFLFVPTVLCAQVRFHATANPSVIGTSDLVTISFILENADDIKELTAPSFDDFLIIGGPARESGISNVNGKVTRYISVSFALKPKKAGTFRLGSARVIANGKKLQTNPVTVEVKKTPSMHGAGATMQGLSNSSSVHHDNIYRDGEDIREKVNQNMFLRVEVNKKKCYVGEPVVAEYKLYSRLKSESRLTQNPSFNGFSVIDLQAPDITGFHRAEINGREYNVYTIRKAQLYPLQAGSISLEPAELENKIQFVKESYASGHMYGFEDFFDGFSGTILPSDAIITELVTLKSQPVSIEVLPLPDQYKPAGFNGAVGKFNISASLDEDSISTDRPGRLLLTVRGAGNLQLVTPPAIQWPKGIEPFEPIVIDQLQRTEVPVSGSRIFEIPFSVDRAGEYRLPPVSFSFFDPSSETFKTVMTNGIDFTAGQGKNIPPPPSYTSASASTDSGWDSFWLIPAGTGVLIGLVLLFAVRRKSKKDVVPVITDEEIVPVIIKQNPLEETEKCLRSESCTDFYILLKRELLDFLTCRFRLEKNLKPREIIEALDAKNVSNEIVMQLDRLIQDIELQLYTPFERNSMMDILYSRTQETVQRLNHCGSVNL